MYCGHVIYKVKHLQTAVQKWREKGFVVEYGTLKNPKNALIYFSEGAYIELLEHTGIPKIVKLFSKIFGKSKRLERFLIGMHVKKDGVGFVLKKVAQI